MTIEQGGIALFKKSLISVRFRKINISLLAVAFMIMAAVMYFAFDSVTKQVSEDYAVRYAVSSAEALSAHIAQELGFLSIAAGSDEVIEWFADENNGDKRARAFEVLSKTVDQLYSYNLYAGFEGSLNEYLVSSDNINTGFQHVDTFSPNDPQDEWYFECIDSDMDYTISVDIDHILNRKRVWLNYRVELDGAVLGSISTGLEFSHVAGELFSQLKDNNIRGLIIDKEGTIHMDSSLMQDSDFLYSEYMMTMGGEFSDPLIISEVEAHQREINGYWEHVGKLTIVDLKSGPHRYMVIAPIRHMDWSIVILSGTTMLFNASYFIPITVTILILLVAFAVLSSIINYRILFLPLSKLEKSLTQLNEHSSDRIYGADRNDELGNLSNTIQDLFNKSNTDPLTGLYNRRFMESSMERIMGLLSRTEGQLSVLMLDIDFFKRFNDTYGHDAGDKCLHTIAHALSDTVSRVNDIVVRYGGEEFAIILPNTDSGGAHIFAERILGNVRELNIPHAGNDAAAHVTISIGVTTGKVNYKHDLSMYLKRADEALYKSKENGRDRYTFLELLGV